MAKLWIERLLDGTDEVDENVKRLEATVLREREYVDGQTIVYEDDPLQTLYAIEDGWIASVRQLDDGSAQIVDFFLPGQVVGLRQLTTTEALVDYRALTSATVSMIDKTRFKEAIESSPELGLAVLDSIAREDSWLSERIATLGSRTAAQCVVHLLLELTDRLADLPEDWEDSATTRIPITQEQLGEILAITPVHVSRVLKELREEGIVYYSKGSVNFPSRKNAELFSDYHPKRLRLGPAA